MTRRNLLPVFAAALMAPAAFASTADTSTSAQSMATFSDQIANAKAAQSAGRVDDAITIYQQAVRKARHDGSDPATVANALNRLGMLYQSEERFEDADASYTRALRTARKAGDRGFSITVMNNLGSLYIDMGQYAKAEKRLAEALRVGRQGPSDEATVASTLNNMGRLAQLEGRPDEAAARYEQAFSRGKATQKIAALNNLATVHREQDQLDGASAAIAQAHTMAQSVYGDGHLVTMQLTSNRAIIELERGEFEMARELAREVAQDSARLPEGHPHRDVFERTQEIVENEAGRVAGRMDRISVLR